MPFRTGFTAQISAYNQGCGLHCLAHAFVLNLKHNRFAPDVEQRALEDLILAFKEEYPAAADLTIAEFRKILVEDLQNPLHREVVLGPVLRRMLNRGAYENFHNPGVPVPEDLIIPLGARLGMRVESYSTLKTLVDMHPLVLQFFQNPANREGAEANLPEPERKAAAEARARRLTAVRAEAKEHILRTYQFENNNFDNDNNIGSLRMPVEAAGVRLLEGAPVLKILNRNGDHWEWEYNIHQDDDTNRQERVEYNYHYSNVNRAFYGDNVHGVSVHSRALTNCFNEALQNRQQIYARNPKLSSVLEAYKDAALARQQQPQFQNGSQSQSQSATGIGQGFNSNPNNANSNWMSSIFNLFGLGESTPAFASMPASASSFGNAATASSGGLGAGVMKLFGDIFNAYQPALTAVEGSRPPMNVAIPVVGNIFHAIRDFFKPYEENAGISSLATLAFGWLGDLFNFFGKAIGFAEEKQKTDPHRPLDNSELQTPEGALFAEYLKLLPDEALETKKKLIAAFHNKAIPREQILNELRAALSENDRIPESDALLFKQHLAKLDPALKRQLQIQYHHAQGGPAESLVWKRLAEHLTRKGMMNEASQILKCVEDKVLNNGFVAADNKPNPKLQEAHDHYEQLLNHYHNNPVTPKDYQTRSQLLEAIEKGGSDGAKILADLKGLADLKKLQSRVVLDSGSKRADSKRQADTSATARNLSTPTMGLSTPVSPGTATAVDSRRAAQETLAQDANPPVATVLATAATSATTPNLSSARVSAEYQSMRRDGASVTLPNAASDVSSQEGMTPRAFTPRFETLTQAQHSPSQAQPSPGQTSPRQRQGLSPNGGLSANGMQGALNGVQGASNLAIPQGSVIPPAIIMSASPASPAIPQQSSSPSSDLRSRASVNSGVGVSGNAVAGSVIPGNANPVEEANDSGSGQASPRSRGRWVPQPRNRVSGGAIKNRVVQVLEDDD